MGSMGSRGAINDINISVVRSEQSRARHLKEKVTTGTPQPCQEQGTVSGTTARNEPNKHYCNILKYSHLKTNKIK